MPKKKGGEREKTALALFLRVHFLSQKTDAQTLNQKEQGCPFVADTNWTSIKPGRIAAHTEGPA